MNLSKGFLFLCQGFLKGGDNRGNLIKDIIGFRVILKTNKFLLEPVIFRNDNIAFDFQNLFLLRRVTRSKHLTRTNNL